MSPAAVAAIALVVMFGALAVFQLALVLGAPFGRFAWGGADRVLPASKRVGSVVSIVLYALFTWIFLMRAGLAPLVLPEVVVDVAAWVVFGYLVLGILMNAASRSRPERFTMTPVAAVAAALALVVALG